MKAVLSVMVQKGTPGQQKDTTVTQEDMTVNIPYTAGTSREPGTKLNAKLVIEQRHPDSLDLCSNWA